jgi:hypothetical protein
MILYSKELGHLYSSSGVLGFFTLVKLRSISGVDEETRNFKKFGEKQFGNAMLLMVALEFNKKLNFEE